MPPALNLSPARWIWYPMGRCLPSTVVLFCRGITKTHQPGEGGGDVLADSRYKPRTERQQSSMGTRSCRSALDGGGPDRSDPLSSHGNQCHRVQCAFFGAGDGTWVIGKPGFSFVSILKGGMDGRSKSCRMKAGAAIWPGAGRPAITSAGTCAHSRRSSTPVFIPTDGMTPDMSSIRTGCALRLTATGAVRRRFALRSV